ncbi:hypothetical protein ASE80_01525 [Pseudomonas sp. Leaf15]|uniref:hypothetical protein n=1 Tax=unclassified Pseudomonas TaxID=196821 RepID=UPI0007032A66|nr:MULTISPECIES: hypothetical protein [unclassified Pseudomonas]KQM55761.1 hypothetical protein ASE80_01525 [Pseudomonas sp. Leaf15]RAH03863.1 hypothetical protein DJ480_05290 [Pseudomonas sp. Leaf98]
MEFSDEYLMRINEDPIGVGLAVCRTATGRSKPATADAHSALLLETSLLLGTMVKSGLLQTTAVPPSIVNGRLRRAADGYTYVMHIQREIEGILAREKAVQRQSEMEQRFDRLITGSFGYELTEGDLNEVQDLLNRLRDLVTKSEELTDNHKERLLKRLEEVQQELHKKLSKLDKLYCLAIEVSVVAGTIGKNAEPLVKVAKALFGISYRTHAHTEGLPSSTTPQLLGDDSVSNLLD